MTASVAANTPRARHKPARLAYADGQVRMEPADRDVFFVGAKEAIRACQQAIRDSEVWSAFEESVLRPIYDWCDARAERVAACYLPPSHAEGLSVYVVGRSPEYDFELSRDVSALTIQFADRGWSIDPHLVPHCTPDELAAMFDTGRSIQVYGD